MKKILCLSFLLLLSLFAEAQDSAPYFENRTGTQTFTCDFDSRIGLHNPEFDAVHARSGRAALRLNKSTFGEKELTFAFKKGSMVSVGIFAQYQSKRTIRKPHPLPVAATGAFSFLKHINLSQAAANAERISKISSNPIPLVVGSAAIAVKEYQKNRRLPQAHMNIDYYNSKRQLIHHQTISVTRAARKQWEPLQATYYAKEEGHAEITLVNTDEETVWFDDLTVKEIDQPQTENSNTCPCTGDPVWAEPCDCDEPIDGGTLPEVIVYGTPISDPSPILLG